MLDDKMLDGYALSSDPFLQGGTWSGINGQPQSMAVFKSSDNGINWDRKLLNKETGDVRTIAVNPKNKKIIYAGGFTTKSFNKKIVQFGRLYKSTDGGNIWKECGTDIFGKIEDEAIRKVLISPADPNKIYVSTDKGVYISTDEGNKWTAPKQKINLVSIVCDLKDKNIIFGCGSEGFFMSKDGGLNWQAMNNGLVLKELLSIDYDAKNRIVYAGSKGAGLFRLKLGNN